METSQKVNAILNFEKLISQ